MNNDPKRAYIDGFKDGWMEAMKTKPSPGQYDIPKYGPTPMPSYRGCPQCGRQGLDSMVCNNPNCPSRLTSGAGAIGAAGAPTNIGVGGIGSNGPTGAWK